jgi:hypothetical protein
VLTTTTGLLVVVWKRRLSATLPFFEWRQPWMACSSGILGGSEAQVVLFL